MFGREFVEHTHSIWITYLWHITRLLVINAKYNDLSFGHMAPLALSCVVHVPTFPFIKYETIQFQSKAKQSMTSI